MNNLLNYYIENSEKLDAQYSDHLSANSLEDTKEVFLTFLYDKSLEEWFMETMKDQEELMLNLIELEKQCGEPYK